MCRKLAIAATALMIGPLALGASPALAWGLGKPAAPAATQTASQAAATAQSPAKPAAPAKASAQDRAAAERLDPLGRAAFWASQVDADPKDAEAGVRLAGALRLLGRYQEAFDAAQAVLVAQPNNVDALLETARVAVSNGQGFFAVEPARKVQAIAPRDWRGPALLAVGLAQAGRPTEALAAHGQALALAPDNPAVLSNAAMFYAAQGDKAHAETLLRKAAAEPGAGLQVRQNLALVLGLEGKLEEAEQIQRQDLPPQMADNNLAYLKAAAGTAGAVK
jgi:Flp pilus assembly protein TadD